MDSVTRTVPLGPDKLAKYEWRGITTPDSGGMVVDWVCVGVVQGESAPATLVLRMPEATGEDLAPAPPK